MRKENDFCYKNEWKMVFAMKCIGHDFDDKNVFEMFFEF